MYALVKPALAPSTPTPPYPSLPPPAAGQADSDSTSSSLAACAAARQPNLAAWLPIIKRHTPCPL